jgi:predicted TPR repeat methyltransferase
MMTKNDPSDFTAKSLLERAHSLSSEAETRALYADWAHSYDKTMIDGLGYLSPAKSAKLLAGKVMDKSARILDVGTGTGLVGRELAKLGYTNIDGVDYSAPMLEVARKTGAYKKLLESDLNQPLGLGDDTYDALICIGTFTHGHIDADCLDELFRILKPGGRFVTAIRMDYWHSAGFDKKVERLSSEGAIKTVVCEEGRNYKDSPQEESWFIVWEKQ